jgi:hypothetical protein
MTIARGIDAQRASTKIDDLQQPANDHEILEEIDHPMLLIEATVTSCAASLLKPLNMNGTPISTRRAKGDNPSVVPFFSIDKLKLSLSERKELFIPLLCSRPTR